MGLLAPIVGCSRNYSRCGIPAQSSQNKKHHRNLSYPYERNKPSNSFLKRKRIGLNLFIPGNNTGRLVNISYRPIV